MSTNYEAFADKESTWALSLALRTSCYAAASLLAVFIFILWGTTEFSVVMAVVFAITAPVIVYLANRGRAHSTLITIFFGCAGAHAIYGYWAAEHSSNGVPIGSNATQLFRESLMVIALTLLIASLAYVLGVSITSQRYARLVDCLRVPESRLLQIAVVFALVGIGCVFYVAVSAGFMPILDPHPGQARFISSDLGSRFRQYDWLLHRGLDLLTVTVPLLLTVGITRHRWIYVAVGAIGFLAAIVPLERAYLISIVVVLLLTVSLIKGKTPRILLIALAMIIVGYFASQLVFLNAIGNDSTDDAVATAVLSALPEVRDLGWTISLLGQDRYYGATFVVPAAVGPGVATAFKHRYGLGYVTIRLAGFEGEATGGLRITLPGEGYLNFGVVGCIIIGSCLGLLCASFVKCTSALISNARCLVNSYVIAVAFVWLCFWMYLGGTANAEPVRNELTALIAMIVLAQTKPRMHATRC